MLKSPKKEKKAINKTKRYEAKYATFVNREDTRRASFNLKKLVAANAVVLLSIGIFFLYTILYNLNRGDYIFPEGIIDEDYFRIPWLGWHAWLENLSWSIGIISAILITLIIIDVALYAYYTSQIRDHEMIEFMSAAAMAERDNADRVKFKERYGKIYDDIKEGKVAIVAPKAAAGVSAAPGPKVIQAAGPLPSIKAPPKISIAAPGPMKLPTPKAAPPIPGASKKKKPSGPITGEKKIYVRCERCEKTLAVKIPKQLVLDNELEVVPVSIIHGEGAEKHILTVHLDGDFKSRRDRVSDMIALD